MITWRERVQWKKWLTVTLGGGGLKCDIFVMTSFLNGPVRSSSCTLVNSCQNLTLKHCLRQMFFQKKRSKNIISTLFSLSKFNSHVHPGLVPTNIYMVKVNNRNTRKTGEICSKLTIISSYGRHWTYAINSKDISYHFLVFLLLNLNR